MFGSCFRILAVILVSDFIFFKLGIPHHSVRMEPLGWSFIILVFHLGGLSSLWPSTRVVSHHTGLPPGWSSKEHLAHQFKHTRDKPKNLTILTVKAFSVTRSWSLSWFFSTLKSHVTQFRSLLLPHSNIEHCDSFEFRTIFFFYSFSGLSSQ